MTDKKPYKALAVDLDGTLLNSAHQISEIDRLALRELREAGVRLITVTGRTAEEILAHSHSLNFEGDVAILQGGSQIVWYHKDQVRSQLRLMSMEDRKILYQVAENNGYYPLYCIEGRVYSKGGGNRFHRLFEEMMSHDIFYIDNLEELQENAPVGKISLLAEHDQLVKSEKEMMAAGLTAPWGRTQMNDYDYGIDVSARSKREALREVLSELGITTDELIAAGDSENDLEMMEFAGLGVAVGNASDKVKARADYVTLDNDHGGVAHVIEKFILNK